MARLKDRQRAEILDLARQVVPGAEWSPEESWLTEGLSEEESRKPSEPLHFRSYCDCDETKEPASLTLFLKGDSRGILNASGKIQHLVEKWAEKNLKWTSCGICRGALNVDVRFFKLTPEEPESSLENEEEIVV